MQDTSCFEVLTRTPSARTAHIFSDGPCLSAGWILIGAPAWTNCHYWQPLGSLWRPNLLYSVNWINWTCWTSATPYFRSIELHDGIILKAPVKPGTEIFITQWTASAMRTGNPTRVHNDVCFYFDDPGNTVRCRPLLSYKIKPSHYISPPVQGLRLKAQPLNQLSFSSIHVEHVRHNDRRVHHVAQNNFIVLFLIYKLASHMVAYHNHLKCWHDFRRTVER